MKIMRYLLFVLFILTAMLFAACGGANHNEELAKDESFYDPGASVEAVDFSEAQTITLYVWKQTGYNKYGFVKVSNGDFLAPGKHKFGVSVTQRIVNGEVAPERVFIGDGGIDYQVEALPDKDSGYYVCDYKLAPADYLLTCPILIQVIYEDALASKEKFVVRTEDGMGAPFDMLADKGLGISLSKYMLKQAIKVVNPMIAQQIKGVSIQDLRPVVGGNGIIHVDLGSIGCDVAITDMNKKTRGLFIGLENITGGSGSGNILNSVISAILKGILGKGININGISVGALGFNIPDMISGLAGPADPDSEDPLAGILTGLKLDSVMFLNLKGQPDSTTENNALLSGSLYSAPAGTVKKDKDGNYIWPSVTEDTTNTLKMDLTRLQGDNTDIGLALSDYNLNQVLSAVMNGFSIEIKDIQKLTDFFSPDDPNNSMTLDVKINPGGIALDLANQRVAVNDVRLTVYEVMPNGTSWARTELSLDVTIAFEAGFHSDSKTSYLDLMLSPQYDKCHIHIMKDNMDMSMFDHSSYFPLIISGFTGGKADLSLSLALSDFGILPRPGIDPGEVEYDNSGNCYMKMAVGDLDASKLPVDGLCFISTAAG
ncbi:MAG TPA: hypothetical protein VIS94_09075 [Desulfomonilia bacterium]